MNRWILVVIWIHCPSTIFCVSYHPLIISKWMHLILTQKKWMFSVWSSIGKKCFDEIERISFHYGNNMHAGEGGMLMLCSIKFKAEIQQGWLINQLEWTGGFLVATVIAHLPFLFQLPSIDYQLMNAFNSCQKEMNAFNNVFEMPCSAIITGNVSHLLLHDTLIFFKYTVLFQGKKNH